MDAGARSPWSVREPSGRAWASSAWKRRPDNLPQLQAAAADRPVLPDPRLRRGPAPPSSPRRPAPAHARRFRQPATLPQYAEHAHCALRMRRRPDHQRERHDQRRRDQVRRQRSAGRHGDQPAPGAPPRHPERRRRPLSRSTRVTRNRTEPVSLVPQIDDAGARPGRRRAGARWAPAACTASWRPPAR